MKASEILVSLGEPMSFPEHLSSPAWPLLASLSAFWLRVSEKLSSLGHRDSVTLRHERARSDRQTHSRKKKRDKSANQSIFYICSVLQYQYFPSISWESACVTPTPTPQGLRSQMSHSPEPLSILVMRCVGDTHKHSHTNQLHEFQWAVSLDTRYSWCLSGGSNQTYWAALLPLMASSNTVTYLANPHERTGSQHRRALLQSRGSYQQKLQTNFHSQTLTGDILCQSTLGNISLYMLFFYRTSEDCNLVRSYFPLPAHFK